MSSTTKQRDAVLKEQLLKIASSLKKPKTKHPKTARKPELLKSVTHLRKSMPTIKRRLNQTAILLLIDPVRALEDIGYIVSPKIQKHLLTSGIRAPKDRSLYDAVKKGNRKIKGINRVSISLK